MAFTVPLRQATSIRRQCILWRIGGGGDTGPLAPNRRVANPALVQQQFLLQELQLQRGRRLISSSAKRCGNNSASNNKTNNNAAAGAQSQSQSPLGHIGVEAALAAAAASSSGTTGHGQ